MMFRYGFLHKKYNTHKTVMICPRCSFLFKKVVVQVFEGFQRKDSFKHKRYKETTFMHDIIEKCSKIKGRITVLLRIQ